MSSLGWAALILLSGFPPDAPAPLPPPTAAAPPASLQEMTFTGLETLSEETLRFYLGLDEGEAWDPERLNDGLHELWRKGLVEDVRVERREVEGGVSLTVAVVERPRLATIAYEDLERLSPVEVERHLAAAGVELAIGTPLDPGRLRRAAAAIEELYRERGFPLATVELRLEEGDGGKRARFVGDPGDKARIARVRFEGNTVFSDRRLRWAMKHTRESGFLSRLLKRDSYSAPELEEDLDRIARLYRDAGYKNVVVGEPEITAGREGLELEIPLEEGGRWRLGGITIHGNRALSDQRLLTLFEEGRGVWLDGSWVEAGVESIRELYGATGHLLATVEPELRERDARVADLVVHIEEGDQYRVGKIRFTGNLRTRDKVLRRELGLQEGMVIDTRALRASVRRLGQLEFFRIDPESPVEFELDPESRTADLVIQGEEGDRVHTNFGGGYGEVDGWFGTASVSTDNYLGRGERLALLLQAGDQRNLYEASYTAPWLLDRPQALSLSASYSDLEFSPQLGQENFQRARGARLGYSRTLGLFSRLGLRYGYQELEDRRRVAAVEEGEGDLEETIERTLSSLALTYGANRVDSRFEPTDGAAFGGSVEVAGGALGGSTSYVRGRGNISLFRTVSRKTPRSVAGFNVEAEAIEPYGGRQLFFNDRLRLGGESSVRGFRNGAIGLLEDDGSRALDELGGSLGGDRSLQANLELHWLAGGPLRLVAYVDAGSVFGDGRGFDLSRFRTSAGIELRVYVPMLGQPLRFIWAENLEPLPGDRFESFQFSFGATF